MTLATIKPPEVIRWSKEFYYQMGELGWFNDKKVELIDGEIFEMSPIGSRHAAACMLITRILDNLKPDNFIASCQNPLNSGKNSEPVPDIVVLPGKPREYSKALPQRAALVVEVADSSLRHDKRIKARLYASQGIQEYWIVDLKSESLIVHREPVGMIDNLASSSYSQTFTVDQFASVNPLFCPEISIQVSSLLP